MILDNEDILIKNCEESIRNPFLGLTNYINVDDLMMYEDEILNIVKNIKFPKNIKKYIQVFNYEWKVNHTNVLLGSNDNYILGIRIINPFEFFELNELKKPTGGNILICISPNMYDINLINKFAKKYNLKYIDNSKTPTTLELFII